MAALARAGSDMVVEILAFLEVESVLQVGAASTSLRTATLLDRVWTPRLATCGLGRFAVDAGALAELSTIKVDARRLCLQCLPWRPRRGTGPDAVSIWQSSWSWRPLSVMPEWLHQPTSSGDWIFVEVYEAHLVPGEDRQPEHVCQPGMSPMESCIKRMVAQKFISVKDCGVDNFPEIIRVPLDVDPGVDYSDYQQQDSPLIFEVRVLMQLDGIMVPLLESCCMEGGGDDERHQFWSQCGFEGRPLQNNLVMDISYPDTDAVCRFNFLDIKWMVYDPQTGDDIPNAIGMGKGEQVMRDFHKANATRLISKIDDVGPYRYSFACDYERHGRNSNLFDFTRKKPAARRLHS